MQMIMKNANEKIDEQLNRLKNRKAPRENTAQKRSNKNQRRLWKEREKKLTTREICSKKNIKKRRVSRKLTERNYDP